MLISNILDWAQCRYGLSEQEYRQEVYKSISSPIFWLCILLEIVIGIFLFALLVFKSEELTDLPVKSIALLGLLLYWVFFVVALVLVIKLRIKRVARRICGPRD